MIRDIIRTLHAKFGGLNVWGSPILYALFVFYCKTIENPLKLPQKQVFLRNEGLKLIFLTSNHLRMVNTHLS